MKKIIIPYLICVLLIIGTTIFLSSCSEDNTVAPPTSNSAQTKTYNSDVAIKWYELQIRLIKQTAGFTPPVVSRVFGYTGITLYESVVSGMPEYKSLVGQLNGFNTLPVINANVTYHWPTCANTALAYITKKLFSNANMIAIDSLDSAFNTTFRSTIASEEYNRSVTYGREIAEAIYNWSTSDGGNDGQNTNFPSNYNPPVGPGLWVPTGSTRALQPYWGNNRPFLTINITTNQPPAPIPFSTSDTSLFYAEGLEVYTTKNNLTTEQTTIARFWADAGGTYTPPGHWIAITQIVLNSLNSKLDVAALAYAKVGIAVTDAFISCWKTKYTYNVLRPITYIRNYIDPAWSPLFETPSFPDYTSGHSTQSGAASQVLSDIFGYNFSFTDNTHPELPYAPRTFSSFFNASNEAAISRLYAGIHYRTANERGLQCGISIGRNVSAIQFLK